MVRKIKAAPEMSLLMEADEENKKVIQWQFIENIEHVHESASESFGSKMEKLGMLYQASFITTVHCSRMMQPSIYHILESRK
jgi:hypothetical protein